MWVLAHSESRDGDTVQCVELSRLVTALALLVLLLSLLLRLLMVLLCLLLAVLILLNHSGLSGSLNGAGHGGGWWSCDLGTGLGQVDVTGKLRDFVLGIDQSRLEVDDVFAQLVIFGLDRLEVLGEHLVVLDLFFELANVAFFALSECALKRESEKES